MAKTSSKLVPNSVDVKNAADEIDDLTAALIKDVNKEFGARVAYNLAESEAPTIVKRWIDTGSIQLNYAIRNASGGGYPEGRIIEIAGPPSIGKSHLAYHAAAVVQSLGGIVIYIDAENATPLDKLKRMGINVKRGFVYMDIHATEHVFKAIENTIEKSKSLVKDVPVLFIWDSVAATSPLAELNGEYEDSTVGLQARVLSKGFRKITGVIGQNNVTLLCINQIRDAIGVMHGDPTCVDPKTTEVKVRAKRGTKMYKAFMPTRGVSYVEKKLTLEQLAQHMRINLSSSNDDVFPRIIDVDDVGLEVETPSGYQHVSSYVIKQKTEGWRLGNLLASSNHRVWNEKTNMWTSVKDMHGAQKTGALIDVVDIEVPEGECYIANGWINHNTTPGGKAIPFHSTVRVRLTSGTQVKDKDGNVIGIHVICTIKKNKVAPPFKKIEFDIIFGKGIVEAEYIFDEVRSYCEKNKVFIDHVENSKQRKLEASITGTGAWKQLVVSDAQTGEVIVEKKFYKAQFEEIMNDPNYKPFVDKIIEATYVMKLDHDETQSQVPEEEQSDE